ncbi:MAG: DinB family protein [Sphingobacteriales bacterium]|nr:DinB family protein [Sphingobacteriales bacterium]
MASIIQSLEEARRRSRTDFIAYLQSFPDSDLDTIFINRSSGLKPLGTFLADIVYHEAYHAGQVQLCLRILHIPIEQIWD